MDSKLRELQLYKLEILKNITDVCERHGLKYYLFGGTLLGCIRHDGFIPWDDDVDIALLWDDYLRLLDIVKTDCPEQYFVQNLWTDKEFPCLWTQIRVNGTTSMPVSLRQLKIHWGICIDVFPLISLSSDETKYYRQRRMLSYVKSLLAKDHMRAKGECAQGGQKLINLLPSLIRHNLATRLLLRYAGICERDEFICALDTFPMERRYRLSDFTTISYHRFEQYTMMIPRGYDAVLTKNYGDYLTPPPPDKRGGHDLAQGETIIDYMKDYKEYQFPTIPRNK